MIVELVSLLILSLNASGGIGALRTAQMTLRDGGVSDGNFSETFHPYVGWTHNPEIISEDVDCCGKKLKANRFGLFDSGEGIYQRSPDRLLVGICGGSVAWQMSCAAEEILKKKLREIPPYREREVVLVRLAQSGYKQPQALFALNYYLLMGAEFDLLLNLDGFNELALTVGENYLSHTALEYPQGWNVRTRELVDPRDADVSLRLFEIRGLRQRAAVRALQSQLHILPSYQLWWHLREERWHSELLAIQSELLTRRRDRQGAFIHTGPQPRAKSEEEAMSEAVRIWKQSSLHLHRLCQAHGITYFHGTQPNQYDPGSKQLTDEERENAFWDQSPYGQIVQTGYPLLRTAGAELRNAGVRHFDLTRLFEDVEETLYIDPFCHVNVRGSQLLAEALADQVRESLQTSPLPENP